ncbi:MAG: nitrous oxidase accessory protein [Candidatus Latescibacterota bacterium]|jgi:nitrous oxidase accessory protein
MKKATALLLSLFCVLVSVSVALSAPLDLQALVDAAAVGDTLDLSIGHYGSARVDKALTIRGQGVGTVVDGGGSGHTLALMAAAISVENLRVTGSGTDVSGKHSGIWVDREADGARIIGVQIDRSGFGIWVDAADEPHIAGCRVEGRDDEAIISDLGNGIHLFNVKNGAVLDNYIEKGRDGVYISNSTGCLIARNRIHRTRFAIHYMYSHHNRVVGNYTDSSSVGIALMYSKGIQVLENEVRASHTHGILLRNLYNSRIEANDTQSSQDGFFFSGCSFDTLRGNLVAANEIGILVSDSPENLVAGNAFVDNRQQLNYQNHTSLVWSGNYWSDYVGWDRNGDGVGDKRHYPSDIAAYLVGRFPAVRLVLHSPAMLLLQGLEAQFPVMRPPGVLEERPLMVNPLAMRR